MGKMPLHVLQCWTVHTETSSVQPAGIFLASFGVQRQESVREAWLCKGRMMDDLIAGYRRFRTGTWQAERSRFEALSRLGQRPRALIIACSDSRTDPQMVFNARPGELFVVRNVANIAPPYARSWCSVTPCAAASELCSTVHPPKHRISSVNGSVSPSRRDSAH
jgi:hypothetical protein